MAEQALRPGELPRPGQALPRRRVLFGLLDATGWTWATIKAVVWLVVIIMLLGYVPDRAYYFTVFSTIDVGLNAWSPINICPPSNGSLPCPAPDGSIVPWQPAQDSRLQLPEPRTDGAAVQSGSSVLYIGGADGSKSQSTVYETTVTADGNLSGWKAGTALPAPRSHEAAIYVSGQIYVIGGLDENGAPTDTVYSATPEAQTGTIKEWKTVDALKLPAPRSDLTVVAAPDGLFAIGGFDGKGATSTVWKATADSSGNLGAWKEDFKLGDAKHTYQRMSAIGVLQGKDLFLYGGSDEKGATAQVLVGIVGTDASGASVVDVWGTAINSGANLPAPRTRAAGFTQNGALYLVGGTADGKTPSSEVYFAVPDANGGIASWSHLSQMDLPKPGLIGGAVVPAASQAFLLGGTTGSGVTKSAERSDVAPKPPVFQLGLFGATIPALGIQKEIGQQLGYLAAAGAGTVNFILLVLIGVAMAHPERTREFLSRFRRRRARA